MAITMEGEGSKGSAIKGTKKVFFNGHYDGGGRGVKGRPLREQKKFLLMAITMEGGGG